MEEANNIQTNCNIDEVQAIAWGKKKKFEHITARPETFSRFRRLREGYNFPGLRSDNAFLEELIRVYEMRLAFLEKKRLEVKKYGYCLYA